MEIPLQGLAIFSNVDNMFETKQVQTLQFKLIVKDTHRPSMNLDHL